MTCLIVSATEIEIAPFRTAIQSKNISKHLPRIDVLISGIGLTATTYTLTKHLSKRKPDCIIQAGLGGCFDTTLPLGKVLAIKKETIADQSVIELKSLKTLFDLKLLPEETPPYKKGWLPNESELIKLFKGKKASGISVNEITTDKKKVQLYKDTFNPVVESMEGAALHYVARMENIPFIQLRAISNYIAERNKKKWDMKTSISNLNHALLKLLTDIKNNH